jgi:Tfp pilus assembly protein PilX
MSKVAITGNASGTGTFTIVSPNSNSDRTLNLPDAAGTLATAESTLTQFNASGSAPVYACRAWVNFNGTGTVAIRASGNVSSITDNNTGNYTVNFTTAMPDANYAIVSTSRDFGVRPTVSSAATTSASQAFVNTLDSSFVSYDANTILVAIFR